MKRFIATLIIIPMLIGCAILPGAFNDATIIAASTVATSYSLRTIQPDSRRTAIANYVEVYAGALRTLTGNPAPDQVYHVLYVAIPANIRAQYPELINLVLPLVVAEYQDLRDRYGANKAVQIANDIATGLEAGAAPYISPLPIPGGSPAGRPAASPAG